MGWQTGADFPVIFHMPGPGLVESSVLEKSLARHPEEWQGLGRAATELSRNAQTGRMAPESPAWEPGPGPAALPPGLCFGPLVWGAGPLELGCVVLLSSPNPLGLTGGCFGNRILIPPVTQ